MLKAFAVLPYLPLYGDGIQFIHFLSPLPLFHLMAACPSEAFHCIYFSVPTGTQSHSEKKRDAARGSKQMKRMVNLRRAVRQTKLNQSQHKVRLRQLGFTPEPRPAPRDPLQNHQIVMVLLFKGLKNIVQPCCTVIGCTALISPTCCLLTGPTLISVTCCLTFNLKKYCLTVRVATVRKQDVHSKTREESSIICINVLHLSTCDIRSLVCVCV